MTLETSIASKQTHFTRRPTPLDDAEVQAMERVKWKSDDSDEDRRFLDQSPGHRPGPDRSHPEAHTALHNTVASIEEKDILLEEDEDEEGEALPGEEPEGESDAMQPLSPSTRHSVPNATPTAALLRSSQKESSLSITLPAVPEFAELGRRPAPRPHLPGCLKPLHQRRPAAGVGMTVLPLCTPALQPELPATKRERKVQLPVKPSTWRAVRKHVLPGPMQALQRLERANARLAQERADEMVMQREIQRARQVAGR